MNDAGLSQSLWVSGWAMISGLFFTFIRSIQPDHQTDHPRRPYGVYLFLLGLAMALATLTVRVITIAMVGR
jgi:hypothetical protein